MMKKIALALLLVSGSMTAFADAASTATDTPVEQAEETEAAAE